MNPANEYDVVIIGGGPAGTTAAAILAPLGHRTLVIERTNFPRFHIGESLMPETYWVFKRIGMLDKLKQSHFVRKYSVQFVNASGKESAPFYFDERNPHECSQTWQVLRSEFDQMMLDNAAERGAEILTPANVIDVMEDLGACAGEQRGSSIQNPKSKTQNGPPPRVTGVVVELPDGSRRSIAAKVVMDATGTNTMLARRYNIRKPDPKLRKASVFAHYKGAYRDPGYRDEGATLVLAIPGVAGWFWYIPLPNDVVSAGVVADIDYLIKNRGTPEQILAEEIERCTVVKSRLQNAERVSPVHVLSDFSYNAKACAGDGWVLIGDAFTFLDPMYSSGVFLALKSAEVAAEAVDAALRSGDTSAEKLGAWGDSFYAGVQAIRKLVYAFYTPEFSFGKFTREHPNYKDTLVRLLIGDVMNRDVDAIFGPMSRYFDVPEEIKLSPRV